MHARETFGVLVHIYRYGNYYKCFFYIADAKYKELGDQRYNAYTYSCLLSVRQRQGCRLGIGGVFFPGVGAVVVKFTDSDGSWQARILDSWKSPCRLFTTLLCSDFCGRLAG